MKTYDFIVVGAGSAGGAVAARLSEDPSVKVLLLEAGGPPRHLLVRVPLSWHLAAQQRRFGWNYYTEAETHAGGRVLDQPRGRLLGGTSSINGMMYSRGNRGDYDGWAAMGLEGWSYDAVLPYFRRSEANWRGETAFHGGSGPVAITRNPREPIVYPAMIAAARALHHQETDDFHGPSQEGFGMPDFAVRRGERESSATGYLDRARGRGNLTVRTGADVLKLQIEGNRVTGLRFSAAGKVEDVAAGEVVLSAGTFNSPKLLMLSGIGPADALSKVGVTPRHDLPAVGQNLQDHPLVPAVYKASRELSFDRLLRLDRLALSALRWKTRHDGPLVTAPLSVQGYLRVDSASDQPDTQFQVSHVSFMARPWFPGWRAGAGHQFTAAAMQLRPFGRGSVSLRSADPADSPAIRIGLLTDERDRRFAKEMLRFIRSFFATQPVAELVSEELMPGVDVDDDAAIDRFLEQTIQTAHHPASTCTMGIDPAASVVDAQLRVHGLAGLRVADASIMPTIASGNTSAPAMMIGEKAADMLLGRDPLRRAEGLPA